LQAPTYLKQSIDFGTTGHIKLQAAQSGMSVGSSFLFQFKLRLLLATYTPGAATNSNYLDAHVGLTYSTTRHIGFLLQCQNFFGPNDQVTYFGAFATNGAPSNIGIGAGYINNGQQLVMSGVDLRVRIGISGANLCIWLSSDGYNWLLFYQEAFATGPSLNNNLPTGLILDLDNGNTSQANNSAVLAFDYVRKIA
jgi:hypothetical protein